MKESLPKKDKDTKHLKISFWWMLSDQRFKIHLLELLKLVQTLNLKVKIQVLQKQWDQHQPIKTQLLAVLILNHQVVLFHQWNLTRSNWWMLNRIFKIDHTNLFSKVILMKKELYIIWVHLERGDSGKIHIQSGKFKLLHHQLGQANLKILLVDKLLTVAQATNHFHTMVLISAKEDNSYQPVIQSETETSQPMSC